MKQESQDDTAPLSRSWLPTPLPPAEDPAWNDRVDQIVVAAAPELHRLKRRGSTGAVIFRSGMDAWWAPALAFAAASIVLMLVVERRGKLEDAPPGSVTLGLIATGGDPVILWNALGIEADRVLAAIAAQDRLAPSDEGVRSTLPGGARR